VGDGKLGFNLSGNYVIENARDGAVNNPAIVEAAGQSVVNDTQEALFFTSRPEMKFILGLTMTLVNLDSILTIPILVKRNLLQQGLQNLESIFC
jgi:iron complex outermembrane receptor protein